jgi:hypothetical protein
MTNVQQGTVSTESAPDFNGMSAEAFTGGSKILDIWNGLSVEAQTEVFPHLIEMLGYDLLQEGATDEQLRTAIEAARQQADSIQHALQSREARRTPQEPRPDDY